MTVYTIKNYYPKRNSRIPAYAVSIYAGTYIYAGTWKI
jgi:hypothetical protein